MGGLLKLAIGRPAIAHEDASELRSEHSGGFIEAAARLNGINRGGRRRKRPEPLQVAGDLPPCFVGADDRTLSDRRDECVVGRLGPLRAAMEGLGEPTGRDGQRELLLKEGADPRERHAGLFVQHGGGTEGAWPELCGGGAQSVGGLQPMPTLHAVATPAAVADVHAERAHERAHGRQLFLILSGDPRFEDLARAFRTATRERRVVCFVDLGRNRALRRASVRGASLAPRPTWMRLRCTFGERGCLTRTNAAGRLQVFPELRVLSLKPIALALNAVQRVAQAPDLAGLLVGEGVFRFPIRTRPVGALGHALVMPDSGSKYKALRVRTR